MDTICAVSTAPGRAGVAVIRVSGPEAFRVAGSLVGSLPEPGMHRLRVIRRPDRRRVDQALVLRFAAPNSFTGEDVVELQAHGSPAVVDAVLGLLMTAGARLAEPGEFTRRAVENDRVSLWEAEGLADLLAAETEAQLDQAQRALGGSLREMAETLRRVLLRAEGLLAATIDFADEEVPVDVGPEVLALLREADALIVQEIDGTHVAERVRQGFEVAIVGAPNVGKSTLLNAIARRDAAIVSEVAGTTRDVIEVRQDLWGVPVTWLDTAGLRTTEDAVERIGIDRAQDRAQAADIRIALLEQGSAEPAVRLRPGDIALVGKADVQAGDISGVTGDGVSDLIDMVYTTLRERMSGVGAATHCRHRRMLEAAVADVRSATDLVESGESIELAAESLRRAVVSLESLVGRVDVEAVLGEVFSTFCIGK